MITGDTGPCAEMVELAAGADLLLCMCWDEQGRLDASGGSRLGCVMGSRDAARLTAEAGAGQLVLLHSTPALDDPEIRNRALAGIRDVFDGPVLVAHEGMTLRRNRSRWDPSHADPDNHCRPV